MANRESYFDNIKVVLIFLVIIGHLIAPIIDEDFWRAIYLFIYTFHMPMFVVVSGYFSRNEAIAKSIKNNIIRFLPTYLIFQSILILLESNFSVESRINAYTFRALLTPYRAMWYLFSLMIWRIILPFFYRVPFPILISLCLALLSGYVGRFGYFLSLSRTFVFFPYFLLGYYLQDNKRFNLKRLVPTKIAVFILILTAILSVVFRWVDLGWFWHGNAYESMGRREWYAAIFRLISLIIGTLVGLSFLSLLPKSRLFFTTMGERTVYIYMLHFPIVRILDYTGFYDISARWFFLAVIPVIGMLMTWFFSTTPVVNITRPLVEPASFIMNIVSRYNRK